MKKIILFIACAFLAIPQSTLPKKQSKSGSDGSIPLPYPFGGRLGKSAAKASIAEDKRSYITELVNDTDCELMMTHPYHNSEFVVIACFELSGDKSALKTYSLEESKIILPPRSKAILSGAFIPFQESKEDRSVLSIYLLGENRDLVQPSYGLYQIGDLICGAFHYSDRIAAGMRITVFGGHSFSLIFKQQNDDLLYKSVKTGKLSYYGCSLSITTAANMRECR